VLTDVEVGGLIAELYKPVQSGLFDHVMQLDKYSPFVGVKYYEGFDNVTVRGTDDAADLLRDGESEVARIVLGFEGLGLVPWGFAQNLAATYAAIKPLLRNLPTLFNGHSLGAAEAQELAGAHLLSGGNVAAVVVCATPRPGTAVLTKLLAPVPLRAYWNKGDPVPNFPTPIFPWFPWMHTRSFITLDSGPAYVIPNIERHRFVPCYQPGIAALGGGPSGAGSG
jgi:pimeloyl-ACP methyl ester carboxylesterase